MNKAILLIISLAFYMQSFGQAKTINKEKSYINFTIGSLGFSSVEGTIKGMSGKILFDNNNLNESYFDVCIDPSTIKTDKEDRDTHLKDPDFFDVLVYKSICFKSKNITKTKYGYEVTGNLTLYDTTKEATIHFSETNGVFKGSMKINRFDYNLGVKKYDGTFMVGEIATLDIVCKIL